MPRLTLPPAPRAPAARLGRRGLLCACCAGAAIGWMPASARAAEGVVPTRLEPHHHVRLENQYMRILQIRIEPGDATLWHEHALDFAGVTVQGSELRNETPSSGQAALIQAKPGAIAWFRYQGHPYVHRVADLGREPFVVDGFEILVPSPGSFPVSDRSRPPPYALQLDNDRLRAWRLQLAPGQSAAPIEQRGPGFRVVLGGDRITQTVDGATEELALEPGGFAYQGPGQARDLRNSGAAAVELVEFELK